MHSVLKILAVVWYWVRGALFLLFPFLSPPLLSEKISGSMFLSYVLFAEMECFMSSFRWFLMYTSLYLSIIYCLSLSTFKKQLVVCPANYLWIVVLHLRNQKHVVHLSDVHSIQFHPMMVIHWWERSFMFNGWRTEIETCACIHDKKHSYR